MKSRVLLTLVFLCLPICLPSLLCAQVAPSANEPKTENTYDVASFQTELRRLYGALQSKSSSKAAAADLSGSLPSSWSVRATGQTYRISTEPLREMLRTSSTQEAKEWIAQLQSEVAGSQVPAAASPAARTELDHILGRKEFRGARAPGPWDELRKRISAWLEKLFLWIFGGILRHPLGGQILFWLLVLGGAALIALWVFRFLVSRDNLNTFQPEPASEVTRNWQEWIRLAREAAGRGDFREAVHSAYWAGIARLEDLGAVPKDRTKTPREYLRYVSQSDLAAADPQRSPREPLKVLTSRMESIWYANRGARQEDFRESLVQLEALGCRLE
jgi:uncharacterized small protein (DUF1192 family)